MFDFEIKISPSLASRFDRNIDRAQSFLDNEVIRQSRPFVPFLQGTLANTAMVERPGRIVYPQPYARRMFYGEGYDFTKTFHANAGARWTDRAKAAHLKEWVAGVKNILGSKE